MSLRREDFRVGWIIISSGRPWDNWVYPNEAAARTTAEQCKVPDATIVYGKVPGVIRKKGQHSERMLWDRKRWTGGA